jgi:hypothetical protein
METFQKSLRENLKEIRSIVKLIPTSISLKNSNSDNKFKINTKLNITKIT